MSYPYGWNPQNQGYQQGRGPQQPQQPQQPAMPGFQAAGTPVANPAAPLRQPTRPVQDGTYGAPELPGFPHGSIYGLSPYTNPGFPFGQHPVTRQPLSQQDMNRPMEQIYGIPMTSQMLAEMKQAEALRAQWQQPGNNANNWRGN